jgi:hypothetical protein
MAKLYRDTYARARRAPLLGDLAGMANDVKGQFTHRYESVVF